MHSNHDEMEHTTAMSGGRVRRVLETLQLNILATKKIQDDMRQDETCDKVKWIKLGNEANFAAWKNVKDFVQDWKTTVDYKCQTFSRIQNSELKL